MLPLLPLLLSASLHAADVSELVAQREGLDPARLGTTWYGVFHETLNVGQLTIEVQQARRRHAATYVVTSLLEIDFLGNGIRLEETLHLDARFSIIEREYRERVSVSNAEREKLTSERVDEAGLWTLVMDELSTTVEYPGASYTGMPTQILLASTLGGHAPGRWTLPVLEWEGEGSDPQVQLSELVIGAPETISHWAESIEATPIDSPAWEGGAAHVADGRTLIVRPAKTPFVFRACAQTQCTENIVSSNPDEAALDTVLTTYMGVVFGLIALDDIDGIVDWKGAFDAANPGQGPVISDSELQRFIDGIKSGLVKESTPRTPPTVPIEDLVSWMIISIDGETASAAFPDALDQALTFQKTPEGWKLISLP